MAVLGVLLFVVCAISVIYPLRFLMIPNRLVAVCGVIASFVIIATNAPPQTKTANAAEQAPAYTSSGGCKTDVNGDMKCSHESQLNLFGSTSRSSSEMKCGQNLVTLAYECKSSSSAY
ncbi:MULTISPECIES: hypothetical protein [unclassified Bradyrhizobium]|uniref:hypothetical protein n=1 Tax=unclassified Bradyrhizobium TaxID=2631580 RepID=UPI0023AF4BAF|nr:hypothetical protein [Bradyrhizobium sp. CSS354]MDE5466323.1 hypothetical protein [Bradyrhizobium sp. CSS354]